MNLKFLAILAVSTSCILASVLTAQEPQMFRYQGRILDNDALVSGNLDFSFKLYDTPTGGTMLYEDAATIMVVDGLYSTMIGDDTTSGGDLGDALNNPVVYLEIEVGGETLTPRERIVSVPYAMNGLPSGSVVLSASNPNAALEAKGYSLVNSDVNSPEDWIVVLGDELAVPFINSSSMSQEQMEMVTFGAYVGFYNKGSSSTEGSNPFYYSQDGIIWNESDLPFVLQNTTMYGDVSFELNASLYMVSPNGAADGGPPLRVATTSNGADWTELSVSLPVSNISVNELVVYANQIWLFGIEGASNHIILKSSDGATWDAVATPEWSQMYINDLVSTPDRLVVLAPPIGSSMSTYVWSTTDGSTWTQSSEVIPSGGSTYGVNTYANGALWTLAKPEGETFEALYKSTDWGNSWSQVTTNLPSIQNTSSSSLMSLAPSPGLMYAFGGNTGSGGTTGTFISEDGTNWTKVSPLNLVDSTNYPGASIGGIDVSSTGKFWIYIQGYSLHSIGGPLRNGRFFYYQKD